MLKSLKQIHEGACSSHHRSATTLHISNPITNTNQTRTGPRKLERKKLSLEPSEKISNDLRTRAKTWLRKELELQDWSRERRSGWDWVQGKGWQRGREEGLLVSAVRGDER